MTDARVFKIENRLAKVISLPGGKTVAEALRAADQRIDSVREDCLKSLSIKGLRLQQLAQLAKSDADDAAFAGLYATANEVFSVASAFDMKELAEAAYGLCDLADDSRPREQINWPAVGVYVDAIRFLGSQSGSEDTAIRRTIVAGLRAVTARFAEEG
jgi:hypothetical protein